MDGMFTGRLIKEDGKLTYIAKGDKSKYDEFVKALDDDTELCIFMEIEGADKTVPQLAKVNKCIRVLAAQIGDTYEGTKMLVKDKTGLIVKGKTEMIIKSFRDCSREELNLAIQTCIEIGDNVTLNLR